MKWRTVFSDRCANLFYNMNKHTKLFREKAYASKKDIVNLYANTACFQSTKQKTLLVLSLVNLKQRLDKYNG